MKIVRLILLIPAVFILLAACASASKEEASAMGIPEESGETAAVADEVVDVPEPEPESAKMLRSEEVDKDEIRFEDEMSISADAGDFALKSAEAGMPAAGEAMTAGPPPAPSVPSQSGLKAGYSDDNRQFGYFLNFLDEYGDGVSPLALDVSERIQLKLVDKDGKTVHGASVSLTAGGSSVSGKTLADGSYQINPSELFARPGTGRDSIDVRISGGDSLAGYSTAFTIDRGGERNIKISADAGRTVPAPIPLDIVFVMDTTGSMGEEIARLKNTIQIIHMNLSAMSVAADIRFGMVLYKDVDDEYRTEVIPLTSDLDYFQSALNEVYAAGGGDTPEDLEAALDELVNTIEWRSDAVKVSYIITDAPPHLDYQSAYTCSDAAKDARRLGIKIFGIGTGGLDLQGEYILRQIAQYTSARYIFLTYGGESGESGGGAPGSVSHHTGSNWNADKLESIIIRFTREELAYLSDNPLPADDPWFEADKIPTEDAEDTLSELFSQAVDQLIDFSAISISTETALAVLPFSSNEALLADAEYFNEHLILAAGNNERIKLAERKDVAQLLAEIELQNIGLTDDGSVAEIGEFLNADILLTGSLFTKDGKYELFLKFLRVETAEVLSVTRAVIAAGLGL